MAQPLGEKLRPQQITGALRATYYKGGMDHFIGELRMLKSAKVPKCLYGAQNISIPLLVHKSS